MAKTTGTSPMTPIEDYIARSLSLDGKSNREIAELLGRSDKSIALAVERAESNGDYPLLALATKKALMASLSGADRKLLTNVKGFGLWLWEGSENGYVAALVRILGGGA